MEYRARHHNGTLRILANDLPDLADGEVVGITIERGRSTNSHKHQFAWLKEAWLTLPEALRDAPWAETEETMRKHALIATGYHRTVVIDCGANATARRVAAELKEAHRKADGYALSQVRGPIATIWIPESQSVRAMGGKRFQESKSAIMDWVAAQLGVPVAALAGAA